MNNLFEILIAIDIFRNRENFIVGYATFMRITSIYIKCSIYNKPI